MSNITKATTGSEIAKSLAAHIRGKTVLVTGGTLGGIGVAFVSSIVKYNPRLVILTARSQEKIDESFASIRKGTPDAPLRSVLLDLSSLEDVRRAAREINAYSEIIDVLVHNAGLAGKPLSRSVDGYEMHLATNHLGPFLLTKLLLPKMLTSQQPPRIVVVSSGVHTMCTGYPWDDPNYLKAEEPKSLYQESKVLNILFASALARRSGGKVEALSLSPGWVNSQLSRYLPIDVKKKMGFIKEDGSIGDGLGTLEDGTRSYLVASFSKDLPEGFNGGYLNSSGEFDPAGVAEHAKGIDLEKRLWTMSEEMVGEKFDLEDMVK